MNYVEFNPQPIWGENTNGVDLVYRVLNERDQSWMTQSNSSVCEWACPGGNGYFAAVTAHLSDEDKKFLSDREQVLRKICSAVAEFVKKDYDISFSRTVEKERTITIDVPKERKIGLFKKEQYIDHETKTEKYSEKENITYKGWRIERLVRKVDYGHGNPPDVMFFDYCLGADGQLYLVASKNNEADEGAVVVKCIFYSLAFLNSTFCNVYSAAISGVVGALDAIPIDENDPLRNVHIKIDDGYYYNFPVQIDDTHSFTYGFLDGTIKRVVNLLDEAGKEACYQKYEWMGSFLYPESQPAAEEKKENALSTQEKFSNASHGYDFNEYVLLGATEVSKKTYAQKNDEFRTDANGCFLSAFLTERLVAADDLLKLYPKFNNLVTAIIDNQQEPTGEKLFAERQLATDISNEYSENGNVPESIFILLTAYAAFLSQGSTDERTKIITKMMVDRVCAFNVVKGGWEEILIAVILWFSDRNGYKEAVVNKYIELMNQPVAESVEYVDKIDIELYARIGAQFYGQYDGGDGVDFRFVLALIKYKLPVAEKVAKEFPSFAPVYEYMRANDQANLAGDFDEIFKASNLFTESVDCAILMASIGTFLDRGNPARGTSIACIFCVERALNKPGEEVVGLPSLVLLCVALWFSDYKGYKERVYEHIQMLVAENWYTDGKNIDLNEVRESIDATKFV